MNGVGSIHTIYAANNTTTTASLNPQIFNDCVYPFICDGTNVIASYRKMIPVYKIFTQKFVYEIDVWLIKLLYYYDKTFYNNDVLGNIWSTMLENDDIVNYIATYQSSSDVIEEFFIPHIDNYWIIQNAFYNTNFPTINEVYEVFINNSVQMSNNNLVLSQIDLNNYWYNYLGGITFLLCVDYSGVGEDIYNLLNSSIQNGLIY